jgi:hypothetical protein
LTVDGRWSDGYQILGACLRKLNAKRDYYGFEFCPGFWDWLDIAWADGRVASVGAVYDELVDYGDQLSDWARDHRSFFLSPGAAEVMLNPGGADFPESSKGRR